jgi:hypothetical protein
MRFEVWHRDKPTFEDNDTRELACTFPHGFTKVAVVETQYVGQVFELTNHVSGPWQDNKEVLESRPARSTSVGDVYVLRESAINPATTVPERIARAYTVDAFGLREWL